jgi:hypothetical protein
LALPAKSCTLGVAAAGSKSAVASFDVTTAARERAFVVAAGVLEAGRGPGFRLLAVDTTTTPWSAAAVLPRP